MSSDGLLLNQTGSEVVTIKRVRRGSPLTLRAEYSGHRIEIICTYEHPAYRLVVDGEELDSGGGWMPGAPIVSGVLLQGVIAGSPLRAYIRNMGPWFRLELSVDRRGIYRTTFR